MNKDEFFKIVERATRGDRMAFEQLCEAKGESILFMSISLMGNHHDAEDMAQEILIAMQKQIGQLKEPYAFNSWLYQIVNRTCCAARKKMMTKSNVSIEDYINILDENNREFLPHEYAEDVEKRSMLMDVVDGLPYRNKICVLLFYFEGLSYADIAKSLEISTKDVDYALTQAKKLIRRELEKKTNTKLVLQEAYAVAPLPVLAQALRIEAKAQVSGEAIASWIKAANIGKVASSAASTAAIAKITAGVVACFLVGGASIFGLTTFFKNEQAPAVQPTTAAAQLMSTTQAEALIHTLEDMIGVENAQQLRDYVAGKNVGNAGAFLNEIGMQKQFVGSGIDMQTDYTLYTQVKQDKLLMVIVQSSAGGQISGVSYRFTTAGEKLPNHAELVESYRGWKKTTT